MVHAFQQAAAFYEYWRCTSNTGSNTLLLNTVKKQWWAVEGKEAVIIAIKDTIDLAGQLTGIVKIQKYA